MSDHLKSSYVFELPDEQIAHYPVAKRDQCRLLKMNKQSGDLQHHTFCDIEELLPENCILVLNDTKVIHARIPVKRKSGGVGEVLVQKQLEDGSFVAIAKPSKRLKEGEILVCLKNQYYNIKLNAYEGDGVWNISILPKIDYPVELSVIGELPLPPYIKRENGTTVEDEENYQTVFSKERGSVAAPTASLHFSDALLEKIKQQGVEIITLTHHVGLGTFYPIRVEDITKHNMHTETYSVSSETRKTLIQAKQSGKKIIAVGTTVVRALESSAKDIFADKEIINQETNLFIYPPYEFKLVDGLITNFHLSESSLLMLVSAFADREKILNAYNAAVSEKYRFFSYGDAMFIL